MPKYVIERDVADAGKLSDEQLREISLRSLEVLADLGPKIQWIHSYVTDNKIYCVASRRTRRALHEHARRAGLPADHDIGRAASPRPHQLLSFPRLPGAGGGRQPESPSSGDREAPPATPGGRRSDQGSTAWPSGCVELPRARRGRDADAFAQARGRGGQLQGLARAPCSSAARTASDSSRGDAAAVVESARNRRAPPDRAGPPPRGRLARGPCCPDRPGSWRSPTHPRGSGRR
jgi:hypothetical protein